MVKGCKAIYKGGLVQPFINRQRKKTGEDKLSDCPAEEEYICRVNHPLHNPVYHALNSGDRHLNIGTQNVKFFDEAVSPFVGFEEQHAEGFDELFDQLPAGRLVLHATPLHIPTPGGWQLLHKAKGLQMLLAGAYTPAPVSVAPLPLREQHIEQMLQLAALTRPGPFGPKTISFGHYHGIFDGETLVAMTGQRLHVESFTEISAVCTHPDYLGKGYAFALVQHQIGLIHKQGQVPFLHVREDNTRAVTLYERMGFALSRPMNFYFLKREGEDKFRKTKQH